MLQTVRIEPEPSRIGCILVSGSHLLGSVLLLSLDAGIWVRMLLLTGLMVLAVWQLRALGWLGGRLSIAGLACHAGGCKVRRSAAPSHAWQAAVLEPDYLVISGLIVMNFRTSGARRSVPCILFPDSAGPDEIRHLRALLRARKIPCRRQIGLNPVAENSGLRSASIRN